MSLIFYRIIQIFGLWAACGALLFAYKWAGRYPTYWYHIFAGGPIVWFLEFLAH